MYTIIYLFDAIAVYCMIDIFSIVKKKEPKRNLDYRFGQTLATTPQDTALTELIFVFCHGKEIHSALLPK